MSVDFRTEADLCATFLAWATRTEGVRCFSEWAGWDILLVYPDGVQLGIQAKLRLNADVLLQAAPSLYGDEFKLPGPDFRAVLVPKRNGLSAVAWRLGLQVFWPYSPYRGPVEFGPHLDSRHNEGEPWVDWNPARRHDLPPVATDSIAGSPSPVTLTPWKLAALDVLAELATKGTITAKRMRELHVHPGRWTTGRWLEPAETRGQWVRGARCPKFDEQHPTAYAAALAGIQKLGS